MATSPFIGEIRPFAFGFAPKNWAQCNGQLLSINTNQALFSLLGTQFGGNGVNTFALPNLQGRAPISLGNGGGGAYTVGNNGGTATVALTAAQIPTHTHTANLSTAANSGNTPSSSLLPGAFPSLPGYTTDGSQMVAMNASTVASAGGGQAHENRQPYLALNMCICLAGIFPSRN